MKVYKETSPRLGKSWAIRLHKEISSVKLQAVDSETGKWIADLIRFDDNGEIECLESANAAIECDGYFPHEHNNEFDELGRIIIK